MSRSLRSARWRARLLGTATHFACVYCRKTFAAAKATLEHIIPLAFGGGWDVRNLALACSDCNHRRNVFVTKLLAGKVWKNAPEHVLRGIVRGQDGTFYFVNHLLEKAG